MTQRFCQIPKAYLWTSFEEGSTGSLSSPGEGFLVLTKATRLGRLQLLRWFQASGRCLGDVCSYAARNGHLEVLQWARANGFPELAW